MWCELQIHIGEAAKNRIHVEALTPGRSERAFLARLSGAADHVLPGEFFHAGNVGASPIRFGGFPGGIKIFGVGARGVDLIEKHGSTARRLVADWTGKPAREVRNYGETHVGLSPYPVTYSIARLVFERRKDRLHEKLGRLGHGREDLRIPEIRNAILRALREGVARQIADLHKGDLALATGDYDDPIDIEEIDVAAQPWEIVSVERFLSERVSGIGQKPAYGLMACDLVVRSPLRLDGVWHVGRLAARGYGQMQRVYGGLSRRRIAPSPARGRLEAAA